MSGTSAKARSGAGVGPEGQLAQRTSARLISCWRSKCSVPRGCCSPLEVNRHSSSVFYEESQVCTVKNDLFISQALC